MAELSELTNELHIFKRQRSLARAVVAMARAERFQPLMAERLLKQEWPNDRDAIETVQRGAVIPTSTTGTTQFNQTVISDIISLLSPGSAFYVIAPRALNVSIDNFYGITIPGVLSPGSGVTFIGQAAAIPVKQLSFIAGPTLVPQRCALITVLTRELFVHSSADILVRTLLAENLSLGLDSILLDATAGDSTRPAGLRNGVGATAATAGGGQVAMNTDMANLAAAIAPVAGSKILFVASPKQAVKMNLYRTGPSLVYPVIASSGLADGIVMCIATNVLAVAGGNDPVKISISEETVLHMEDSTPAALSTVATPNTVAAPLRSLWQTDAIAIRLVADLTWAMRASGGVSWTQSVTW